MRNYRDVLSVKLAALLPSTRTIAFDLEGTLISNAVSMFARPGLFELMDFCLPRWALAILTTVPESRTRTILSLLIEERCLPRQFLDSTLILGGVSTPKDLSHVGPLDSTILVDDYDILVAEQRGRWIPIPQFAAPYTDNDIALFCLLNELQRHTSEGCFDLN